MRNYNVDTRNDTSLRIVAYIDGGSEPTTHAMQDISILKDEFEKWGGSVEFVFQNDNDYNNFKLKNFNALPENIIFKVESNQQQILPIFFVLNEKDEVVFEKSGYTIGLGEQLLKALK